MEFRIRGRESSFNFDTSKEVVTIGRSSENDFVIPLPDFSRKHCVITIKGTYLYIMDLGSKNGVLVDGIRITPHEQVPIYPKSKIILANHFALLFPDGTAAKEIDLKLVAQLPRR